MDNFMNIPDLIDASDNNIIEVYKRSQDVRYVARVFKITVREVNVVLKRAGIIKRKKKKESGALEDYGMTERDFYHDVER